MPFNATEYMIHYIEEKYKSNTIQIIENCCKRCLRGPTTIYDLRQISISDLISSGKIEPQLAVNAIHTGSAYHSTYLKDKIINVNSECVPCKYPANCNLTCVVCRGFIINRDEVQLDIWPGFFAHRACICACLYPGCKKFLPIPPTYLYLHRTVLMCEDHRSADALYKASLISTRTGMTNTNNAQKPDTNRPCIENRTHQIATPKLSVQAGNERQEGNPAMNPVKRNEPISRHTPQLQTKASIITKRPKKQAKADKFEEKGRSADITSFFAAPLNKPRCKQKAQTEDHEPRQLIRNKSTGEVFAYWKGNVAHHIETDEVLFTRENKELTSHPRRNKKLDFTPPMDMPPVTHDPVDQPTQQG